MKKFPSSFFTSLLFLILASSCSLLDGNKIIPPLDYLEKGVKIDIKNFFNGDVEGFAIIQDQDSKIIGTKTIKMSGKWEDNKGVIQHVFTSLDGSKENRTWLITLEKDGTYDAVGHDVISPAQGKQLGNSSQIIYSLRINGQNGKEEFRYEDKTYLIDENSAIMISNVKKGHLSGFKIIASLKKVNNKLSPKDKNIPSVKEVMINFDQASKIKLEDDQGVKTAQ
jgi:hypothetical protein